MQEPAWNSVEFLATEMSFIPIFYNKRENAGRILVHETVVYFAQAL
jgi:hypothetical protein